MNQGGKGLAANSSLSNYLYPLPAAKASARGAADGRGWAGGERSGTLGLMSPLNCRVIFSSFALLSFRQNLLQIK